MIGPVDFEKSVNYWQQDKWNGQFPVKWHIVKDVPNNLFRHIILENNDNKPVTNSRDTQEVSFHFYSHKLCHSFSELCIQYIPLKIEIVHWTKDNLLSGIK